MSEYYAQDIRDDIITLLTSGEVASSINSLSAQLTVIDTERTQTTPKPAKITYKWGCNQYPLVIVDSEAESMINDEVLSADLSIVPQIFTFLIHIQIKSAKEELHNYIENYIQAIKEILQGYCSSNITYMFITDTAKSELYQRENQRFKIATVGITVRIN